MKKIFLMLVSGAIALSPMLVQGQTPQESFDENELSSPTYFDQVEKEKQQILNSSVKDGDKITLSKKRSYSGWFNFQNAMSELGIASFSQFFMPVHTDTLKTVITGQDGAFALNPRHSVGAVIDPTSSTFSGSGTAESFTQYTEYSWDSVSFIYNYIKAKDSVEKSQTTYKKDTVFEFTVNGAYMDTLRYMKDTTWMIDSTMSGVDSSALPAIQLDYYGDTTQPDQITSSMEVWPAYNVIDGMSGQVDTHHIQPPDSVIYNDMIEFRRGMTNTYKEKIVDTLILQFYRGQNPALLSATDLQLDGGTFVNAVSSPYYYTQQRGVKSRGINPTDEIKIPLTENYVTHPDSTKVLNQYVGLNNLGPQEWNSDSTSLSGIAAVTVTFKPGYDVPLPDTFADLTQDNPDYKHNMFRVQALFDQSSVQPETHNLGISLITLQRWYHEFYEQSQGIQYSEIVYRPGNFTSGDLTYFNIGFHLSSDNNLGVEGTNEGAGFVERMYPNPVEQGENGTLTLNFEKRKQAKVVLYNTIGQQVKAIANQTFSKGEHTLNFNTNNLEPGVYFMQINAEGQTSTVKFSVVK